MSESKEACPGGTGYEPSGSETLGHPRGRSREIPASEYAPSIWHNHPEAGFPRVGEEIQIHLSRDRILVLKYKETSENSDLVFKWVAMLS